MMNEIKSRLISRGDLINFIRKFDQLRFSDLRNAPDRAPFKSLILKEAGNQLKLAYKDPQTGLNGLPVRLKSRLLTKLYQVSVDRGVRLGVKLFNPTSWVTSWVSDENVKLNPNYNQTPMSNHLPDEDAVMYRADLPPTMENHGAWISSLRHEVEHLKKQVRTAKEDATEAWREDITHAVNLLETKLTAGAPAKLLRDSNISFLEQLNQLRSATYSGDLMSKDLRDQLVEKGLASRSGSGFNIITPEGLDLLAACGILKS